MHERLSNNWGGHQVRSSIESPLRPLGPVRQGGTSDAKDWAIETTNNPRDPLELLLRVATVSLETETSPFEGWSQRHLVGNGSRQLAGDLPV